MKILTLILSLSLSFSLCAETITTTVETPVNLSWVAPEATIKTITTKPLAPVLRVDPTLQPTGDS